MFDQFISFFAKTRPHDTAVVTMTKTISFVAFDRAIDQVAAALVDVKAPVHEAIAIDIRDPYRHWLMALALARLGIASSPTQDVVCRLRIGDEKPSSSGFPQVTPAWFEAVLAGSAPPPARVAVDRDALGRILPTSGTTGVSKRIGLSWRRLDAILRNTPIAYGAETGGRWLPLTGPINILGFALSLGAWATANAVVMAGEDLFTGAMLNALRPTLIGTVPNHLQDFVRSLPPDFRTAHPLRIVTGGSALPVSLARQVRERLTPQISSVYGASECGSATIADAATLERVAGAAGYVLPGVQVEIVDGEGRPAPAGEAGEIRIYSDRVAGAYLDDPERSAKAFRDGWYHPGDRGRFVENNLLVIEGRVDDLMNLGGDKVLPSLIEDQILGCPGVREAVAFSCPDETGLERAWLAVVPDATFEAAVLERRIRENLGWLGHLFWVSVDRMPRNQMGKVQRDQLRAVAQRFSTS